MSVDIQLTRQYIPEDPELEFLWLGIKDFWLAVVNVVTSGSENGWECIDQQNDCQFLKKGCVQGCQRFTGERQLLS
jgi:hypothetical protein